MVKKQKLDQEKANISNALHIGSHYIGLSDDEQAMESDDEATNVPGSLGNDFIY